MSEKKTFFVIATYACDAFMEVNATTPDAAEEKFWREHYASLCHQCSDGLTLSDPVSVKVLDADQNVVLEKIL
jgi:hypothetical protein